MRTILFAALVVGAGTVANGDAINIAFHNGQTTRNGMTTRPDGTVVATTTDTWNNVENNGAGGETLTFTGFALLDSGGASTTATLDAGAGFSGFNSNGWGTNSQDYVMMEGWYGIRSSEFVTVNNLPSAFTDNGYSVTIYGDSNSNNRDMDYRIGGTTETILDRGLFSGTFVEGSNFEVIDGLSSASFTILGNTGSGDPRSAINGIIIQSAAPPAIPEPSTFGLAALGMLSLGLVGGRRRRKR